jgi:TPR repeat protein
MPKDPSKRLSTATVVALVFLPIVMGLVVVVIVAVGWSYYGRRHSEVPTVGSANTTPSLDMQGAVAILRGNAKPELMAAALVALEQQAKSGNAKAMVMTAACYRAGLGTVHDDLFKAFEWYRKAAQAGEPVAMVELSHYYTEGVWVEANAAESKRWLERAAQAGNAEAKWQLAKGGK